jgi:hypothetical protein
MIALFFQSFELSLFSVVSEMCRISRAQQVVDGIHDIDYRGFYDIGYRCRGKNKNRWPPCSGDSGSSFRRI